MKSVSSSIVGLAWRDLCVSTQQVISTNEDGQNENQLDNGRLSRGLILQKVSGVVHLGTTTTIMGPSGAGKTSLMRKLFGMLELHSSGDVYVDGKVELRPSAEEEGDEEDGTKSEACLAGGAAFITQSQEECLLQYLTVEESLFYSSQLRKRPKRNRFFIYDLMYKLGLEGCGQTMVKDCSGGQRKRLVIAQELTAERMPKLLFLDEPTSGLDSNASYALFMLLHRLSRILNIGILTCIHQPSFRLLETVDQLYILSKRGRCLYSGSPSELKTSLNRVGIDVQKHSNPADVFIELASLDVSKDEFERVDKGKKSSHLIRHKKASFLARRSKKGLLLSSETSNQVDHETLERLANMARIRNETSVQESLASLTRVQKLYHNTNIVSFRHFSLLTIRAFKNNIQRQSGLLLARIALCAIFVGFTIYLYDGSVGKESGCILEIPGRFSKELNCLQFKSTMKKMKTLVTNNQILQTTSLFIILTSCLAPIISFSADLGCFINEHRNGWYSTLSYYLSRSFLEILIQLPMSYFTCLLIYWKTNQYGLDTFMEAIPLLTMSRFQQTVLIMILLSLISQGLGFAASTAFPQMNVAILFCISIMILDFLFCDYFLVFPPGSLCSFVSHFSFSKFSFGGTLISIYGQRRCESILATVIDGTKEGLANSANSMAAFIHKSLALSNETHLDIKSLIRRYVDKLDLSRFDLKTIAFSIYKKEEGNYLVCVLILMVHLLFWRLLAYFILLFKVNSDFGHLFKSPIRVFKHFKLSSKVKKTQ